MQPVDLHRIDRIYMQGRAVAECARAGRIIWSEPPRLTAGQAAITAD